MWYYWNIVVILLKYRCDITKISLWYYCNITAILLTHCSIIIEVSESGIKPILWCGILLVSLLLSCGCNLFWKVWTQNTCLTRPRFIQVYSGNERSCICVLVHVYINFASFYDFSSEFWSCSDSVIFVLFYYHKMTYISAEMLTKDNHCLLYLKLYVYVL